MLLWEDPWIATSAGTITFSVTGLLGMALLFAYRRAFSQIHEIRQTVFPLYSTVLLSAMPFSIFFALMGLRGGAWGIATVFAGFFWVFVIVLSTEYSSGGLQRLMRVIRSGRAPDA